MSSPSPSPSPAPSPSPSPAPSPSPSPVPGGLPIVYDEPLGALFDPLRFRCLDLYLRWKSKWSPPTPASTLPPYDPCPTQCPHPTCPPPPVPVSGIAFEFAGENDDGGCSSSTNNNNNDYSLCITNDYVSFGDLLRVVNACTGEWLCLPEIEDGRASWTSRVDKASVFRVMPCTPVATQGFVYESSRFSLGLINRCDDDVTFAFGRTLNRLVAARTPTAPNVVCLQAERAQVVYECAPHADQSRCYDSDGSSSSSSCCSESSLSNDDCSSSSSSSSTSSCSVTTAGSCTSTTSKCHSSSKSSSIRAWLHKHLQSTGGGGAAATLSASKIVLIVIVLLLGIAFIAFWFRRVLRSRRHTPLPLPPPGKSKIGNV